MKRIVDPDLARDISAIAAATGLVGVSFGAIALAAGISPWLTGDVDAGLRCRIPVHGGGRHRLGRQPGGRSTCWALAQRATHPAGPRRRGTAWPSWAGRLIGSHLLVDESVAFTLAQSDPRRRRLAYWTTGLSLFVAWNVGVIVGALAGRAVGDPHALGLDAAFPAALVALLLPSCGSNGRDGWLSWQLWWHSPHTSGAAGLPVLLALLALPAALLPSRRPATAEGSADTREPPDTLDRQEDPVTLVAILLFAGGTYALRLAGPVLYNRIDVSDRTRTWLTLPTVALLAALAATATLLPGGEFDSVARVVGVAVGIVAALRRLPFVVVVLWRPAPQRSCGNSDSPERTTDPETRQALPARGQPPEGPVDDGVWT